MNFTSFFHERHFFDEFHVSFHEFHLFLMNFMICFMNFTVFFMNFSFFHEFHDFSCFFFK